MVSLSHCAMVAPCVQAALQLVFGSPRCFSFDRMEIGIGIEGSRAYYFFCSPSGACRREVGFRVSRCGCVALCIYDGACKSMREMWTLARRRLYAPESLVVDNANREVLTFLIPS